MKSNYLLVLWFIMLTSVTVGEAREYHVSLQGADTNAGTLTAPLKTIQSAADRAQPGDVLTVHEGNRVARYNVVWERPSTNVTGQMPLGNGDIAAGIYAIEDGDLYLLLAKTTPIPTTATSSRPGGSASLSTPTLS